MKKFLSLFLALIVAVGVCCSAPMTIEAEAATFSDINQNNVFIKQAVGAPTCTLCATINMMRRTSMLRGDANWATLTEATVKSTAWISGTGLRGSFTYSNSANGIGSISVTSATLPGNSNNTSKLISLLAAHPEGIVIYNGTHAVLLTDYTDGVFYCNDPDDEQPVGRVNVSRAYSVKPTNATKYWYVSSPKVNIGGSSSGTTTPSVSAATITEDLYYLKNKSTGDYLSVSCSEDKNGADVSHWSKSEEFQVKIKKNSNGYEMWFPNVSSTRVVNQWGDVPAAGARITLYTHSGNKTQSWIFQKYSDGYLIRSAYNTNLFMTINSYGQVILDNFTGGSGQIWYLEKVKPNPPAAPTVKMSKTSFAVGESVTISWNSVSGATSYWISAWKSSDHVINEASTSLSKTVSFENAGTYSVAVSAKDAYGQQTLSEWVTFTVYKPYTVKYDANGGTGAPSSQTKKSTSNLTLSSTKPTKTGYTFLGWGTSASDTTVDYAPGATYSTNANITLYAIWKIDTYTVSYNANGGTGAPASQTKVYGTNLTLSTTKPTRSGYTFKGWGTSTGDTSVNYNPGDTYKSNSSITLYAIWSRNSYNVYYNANGGRGEPASQTKYHDEALTLSSVVPTRSGYTFLGWGTSAGDTSVNYAPGGTYTKNEEDVLYAIWQCNHSLGTTLVNAKEPTYTETGYTGDKKCDTCGKIISTGSAIEKLALSAPKTGVANTQNGIKVTWNAVEGAESYKVFRKQLNGSTWSAWSSPASGLTTTSYVDKTVKFGVTYIYAVVAVNESVTSSFVQSSQLTYNVAPTVTIANGTDGIKVSWNVVSGATSYKVFRRELNTSNNTWSAWSSPASGLTGNAYVDKNIKYDVTYSYAVIATNGTLSSSYIATSGLKCTVNPAPVAPTVTIANGTDGIKVSWNSVSGATSYKVFRRQLNANNTWGAWSSPASGITTTSYVDKTAKYGVTYSYAVIATNGTLSSSYIATSGLKCTVNPAPVAPTVTIANGIDGIKVTWNKINGATSYKVFRRQLNANNTWGAWSSPASGITTTSYIDKTVNLGVTYSYAVVATNSAGSSNYVATSGLKCNIAPTVTIANGTDGIKVTWNKINGATSYKVFRRELNTTNNTWGAWSSPASGLTTTSYVDKTAKFGAKYSYAVVAVNNSISSSYVATSALQCGTAPTVTIGSDAKGIRINWSTVSGADSYIVYKKIYNATTGTWGGWITVAQGAKGTTTVDTGVVNGTYYIYTVRASKDGFNGSFVQSNVAKYVK